MHSVCLARSHNECFRPAWQLTHHHKGHHFVKQSNQHELHVHRSRCCIRCPVTVCCCQCHFLHTHLFLVHSFKQTRENKFTCLRTQFCLSVVGSLLIWLGLRRFPAVTQHGWLFVVLCESEVRGCVTVNGGRYKSQKHIYVRLSTDPAVFRDVTQC